MGSGVTNFLSVVEARSLGTADIDKMSAAIDKQSAALENLGKNANKINEHKGFGGFADKIKQGISDPLGAVEGAAVKALEAMGPIGAITAGAGAALGALAFAGFKAAESLAAYGQQIENTGLRTGLTTKEVVQFGFAARLVDQDLSVFDRTMRGLTAALTDNSSAGAKARDALKELGISPRTLNGELKPTGELLMELSAALGAIPNAIDRNKAGMEIFKRAWVEIAPAILKLNEGVKVANREGLWGPNEQQLAQWDKYDVKTTVALAKLDVLIRKGKEWLAVSFTPDNYYDTVRQRGDTAALGGAPPVGAPGAPRSSIADALFGGDASRINADRSAGSALLNAARTRIDATLEGLRFRAAEAKTKYEEAYNSIRTLSDVGAAAAEKEISTVSSLKRAYEGLNEQLKLAEKNEAARLAVLEKAQTLRSQGQGFYQFGSGTNSFFVTSQQMTAANTRKPGGMFAPSLFRSPSGRMSGESETMPLGGFTPGVQSNGDFVIGAAGAQIGGASVEQLNARSAALTQQRLLGEQVYLGMLHAEADFTAQIVGLRAGPGGELAAARVAAGIRESALQRELELTHDIGAYRERSEQNQLELALRVAELQRKRMDDLRSTGGQLFDAALGGGSGLAGFAKNFLLGQGRTIAGNVFADVFKNTSAHMGSTATWAQGTMFGQDPLKGATDMNTMATVDNTRALMTFAGRVAASASGGGGGLVAGLAGLGGGDGAPDSYLGGGDWGDGTMLPAKTGGGSFNWGRAVGIGGAAIGGGFGIYSGVKSGGGRGAMTAAASAIGMAGAIISLSSKALHLAGPIGMLAGTGLGLLIPALFGDPKKNRANDIDAELSGARYAAPASSTYTMDRYGRGFDSDMGGGLRVQIIMPVQTMDAKSFQDSAPQFMDVVTTAIRSRMYPHFETAVRRTAFSQ